MCSRRQLLLVPLVILLFLFAPSQSQSNSVWPKVLMPNYARTYRQGGTINVIWEPPFTAPPGVTGTIILVDDATQTQFTMGQSQVSANGLGYFDWYIISNFPLGTQYRIRVECYGSADESDEYFTIASYNPDPHEFEPTQRMVPTTFGLGEAYPNPFNPVTTIPYFVPSPGGVVTLDIYDVQGRRVTQLVNNHQEPGAHTVDWHGKNSQGHGVSSGTYFIRMTAPGYQQTQKLLLLK